MHTIAIANAKTCGQGARKSAAKTALFRAPLALTVSIDLSASDGEQGETREAEVLRLLEACKSRCKKRRFRRGLDAGPEAVTSP